MTMMTEQGGKRMIRRKTWAATALSFSMCMSGMVLPSAVWAQTEAGEEIEVFTEAQHEEITGQEVEAEKVISGILSDESEEAETEDIFGAGEETEVFASEEETEFSDEAAYGAGLREERIELNVREGQNILTVLDAALKRAEKTTDVHYTVVIPPGNYTINGMLHVFSNTTIYAEGAVITKTSGSKMIKAGTTTYIDQHQTAGYDLFRNIEIIGGTWDNNKTGSSAIKFGHSSNITLRNMTILGNAAGAHLLEVGGVDGLTVENCVFRGYAPSGKYDAQEAIEIECARSSVFTEYPPFNDLPCKNISITGCTFDNLVSGVGMHNAVLGNYTDNISIVGNTFRNIGFQSIKMAHTRNLVIENNKFENVCCAVEIEALNNEKAPQTPGEPFQADTNIRILGNTISLAPVIQKSTYAPMGISLKGTNIEKDSNGVPKGIYKLSGVVVQNNTITGSGRGISLEYSDNCQIVSNKISFSKSGTWGTFKGFPVLLNNGSCGNVIKSCTIDDTYDDNEGIRIINASNNNTVQSCTIGGGKKYSIAVRNSDGVKLTGNKVSKRATGGICVDNAKSCQIVSNRSESNSGFGLLIKDSRITRLEKNVFTGNKKTAVSINNSTVPSGVKTLNVPTVGKVTSSSVKVTGNARGTAKVTVKAGSKTLGTASVKADGAYTVKIPKQKKKTKLVITAVDKKKNQVILNTTVK